MCVVCVLCADIGEAQQSDRSKLFTAGGLFSLFRYHGQLKYQLPNAEKGTVGVFPEVCLIALA